MCLSISVVFVLAVVVLILVVIIPEVVVAVETLIRRIPDVLTQLEEWLTGYNTNLRQLLGVKGADETSIRDFVERAGNFMVGGLSYSSSVVFTAAQLIINLVVGWCLPSICSSPRSASAAKFARCWTRICPKSTAGRPPA